MVHQTCRPYELDTLSTTHHRASPSEDTEESLSCSAAAICAAYQRHTCRSAALAGSRANQQPRDKRSGWWHAAELWERAHRQHARARRSICRLLRHCCLRLCCDLLRTLPLPHKHASSIHTLAANFAGSKQGARMRLLATVPHPQLQRPVHSVAMSTSKHPKKSVYEDGSRSRLPRMLPHCHTELVRQSYVTLLLINRAQFVYTNTYQLDSQPRTKAMLTFPRSSGRDSAEGLVPAALLLGSSSALPLPATKVG